MSELPLSQTSQQTPMGLRHRIAYFPLSMFAIVMGLAGLAIAMKQAAVHFTLLQPIAGGIGVLTTFVFLFLSVTLAVRILHYGDKLLAEVNHPVQINFLPAISISLLLLSVFWQAQSGYVFAVWCLGAALQLLFTLFVVNQWLYNPAVPINTANPAWFIPAVGNIIVPLSGTYFGYLELSWFFFAIGIGFWVVLTAVILLRLFFHDPLPDKLKPTLFILLAPPSIGFIAYTNLVEELDGAARILFYLAVFFALFFASHVGRFLRLPFFLSSWAFSFPLAALTIACFRMAELSQVPFWRLLAMLLLVLLSVVVVILLLNTVFAYFKRTICVPEP